MSSKNDRFCMQSAREWVWPWDRSEKKEKEQVTFSPSSSEGERDDSSKKVFKCLPKAPACPNS